METALILAGVWVLCIYLLMRDKIEDEKLRLEFLAIIILAPLLLIIKFIGAALFLISSEIKSRKRGEF